MASLVIQTAPFISIIILELLRPGFDRRIEQVFGEYHEATQFREPDRRDFEDYAMYSFDYENTVDHLELTFFTVILVFVGKLLAETNDGSLALTGVLFVLVVLVLFTVRYVVRGYFERRSPHRYRIEDQVVGVHYGTLFVLGSNLFVILVIIVTEIV